MTANQILNQKSLVIIFAYAAAGLGHLRVTDALYHGLPEEITPLLLRTEDKTVTYMHRLTSIYPLGRKFLEWTQKGIPEEIFTRTYRWILCNSTKPLYQQMSTILDERIDLPKTVLIIATHFGLAHQLAAIKKEIEKDKKVKVYLIVQITDDSPQHFWYVPGADIIFAPSKKTKEALIDYGKINHFPPARLEVLPYPISPQLGEHLSAQEYQERLYQTDPISKSNIHFAIPVSGAAVGTDFSAKLMDCLYQKSTRFTFHVILKTSADTKEFLNNAAVKQYIKLTASPSTRDIIDKYEHLYEREVIGFESTKPSEQSFKALLSPKQRGGSLLLLTKPVGRQEYDNLNFLRRHSLIPSKSEEKELFERADKGLILNFSDNQAIFKNAANWRGMILPENPVKAANFILWCLKEGLFTIMTKSPAGQQNNYQSETGGDGVKQFWHKVANFLSEADNSNFRD